MASGRPSRRRHSEATAAAFSSLTTNVGSTAVGAIGEQADGVDGRDPRRLVLPDGRRRQWCQRDDDLAGHAERFPAGRQHSHAACCGEQLMDEGRRVTDDVLAVVEHDHAAEVGATVEDGGVEVAPWSFVHADRLGDS